MWRLRYLAPHAPASSWRTWYVIDDVPRDVNRDGVTEALESWARWPSIAARAPLGSRLAVVAVDTQGPFMETGADHIPWSTLAPKSRRLTVEVDGITHARLTRAARVEGISLAQLVLRVLADAVPEAPALADVPAGHGEDQGAEVDEPAAGMLAGGQDVPLPLDEPAAAPKRKRRRRPVDDAGPVLDLARVRGES